jgi:hypothetical protein
MMTLDFQHEIDQSVNSLCKSVLYINCVDMEQNVYLLKVINFRTFFYVQAPQISEEDLLRKTEDLKK